MSLRSFSEPRVWVKYVAQNETWLKHTVRSVTLSQQDSCINTVMHTNKDEKGLRGYVRTNTPHKEEASREATQPI